MHLESYPILCVAGISQEKWMLLSVPSLTDIQKAVFKGALRYTVCPQHLGV